MPRPLARLLVSQADIHVPLYNSPVGPSARKMTLVLLAPLNPNPGPFWNTSWKTAGLIGASTFFGSRVQPLLPPSANSTRYRSPLAAAPTAWPVVSAIRPLPPNLEPA